MDTTDLRADVEQLVEYMSQGDSRASKALARIIQADTNRTLVLFAEALTARLTDHLKRYAELGETDPDNTLTDEVYRLMQTAAIDWDGRPKAGRPGEEA